MPVMMILLPILLLVFGHSVHTEQLHFSIVTNWNSTVITDHRPIELTLSSTDDNEYLIVEIDSPLFKDPAPAFTHPPGPLTGLWNYEAVELFFLSSKSNRYTQLEFSPYGFYYVFLFNDRHDVFRERLLLSNYTVERPTSDRWIGRVNIPRDFFVADVDRFNAAAMHDHHNQRSYESLYPAPSESEKPDFHRLEFFKAIDFGSLLNMNGRDGNRWLNH